MGTLGIVAVGALILAAPFIAQAATEEVDPATTEVSAGGVTLASYPELGTFFAQS